MEADVAARSLDSWLRQYPWYISTGVGATERGTALFVYVKNQRHPVLRPITEWMGYPVIIRVTGSFKPITEIGASNSATQVLLRVGPEDEQ